ncbi:hypothetical protein [Sinomonas sp.]|jgi:hypothetical protein|uniref:hypothetical protein n=1 Tax=Sinomonas sp. TaxID=1914986 RepID=UPI002FE17FB3
MTKFTPEDLAAERAEMLPERDTLSWFTFTKLNLAHVNASNASYAVNVASVGSQANSMAVQNILVTQH